MQNSRLAATAQNIVVRLGGAVADQEITLALHNLLGPLPWQGPMVPGMRSQLPSIQTQLPLQGLLQGQGLLLIAGIGLAIRLRSGGSAAVLVVHLGVAGRPMRAVAL